MTDSELMGLALEEARKAAALGEVPVGAVVARNGDLVHADPELEDLVRTDPSELVRGYLGDACERCGAPLEDGGSECAQCHRTVCGNRNSRCA